MGTMKMGAGMGRDGKLGRVGGKGGSGFDGRVGVELWVYLYILGHQGCRLRRSRHLEQSSEVPVFPSSDHMVPFPFCFDPKLSKSATPHVHRIRKAHIPTSPPRPASTTPRN